MVEEVYQASPLPFDRKGDFHHDTISAFIKSMRGSDPDARLFRVIEGGFGVVFGGVGAKLIVNGLQELRAS